MCAKKICWNHRLLETTSNDGLVQRNLIPQKMKPTEGTTTYPNQKESPAKIRHTHTHIYIDNIDY